MPLERRVIKLGGSLLDCQSTPRRLRDWMARQSPAANLLIAGGGAAVKQLQNSAGPASDPDVDHFEAIERMYRNLQRVARWLPDWWECDQLSKAETACPPRGYLFDCRARMRCELHMPRDWTVTSDSIAALLAIDFKADELVLLKSALPRAAATRFDLAHQGYVDSHFPIASRQLSRIRLVNLRDDDFPEIACP